MWHRTSTVIIVYGITTICTNVVPMNLLHVYSQQLSYHCSNNLSWTTPPRLFQNIHSQPPDKSPLCRLMRTFLKQWTWICFNCFLDNAVNNCAAAWCYNNDHKSAQLEELVLLLIVPSSLLWFLTYGTRTNGCHAGPALEELHWLPLRFRTKFKVALLMFMAHTHQPMSGVYHRSRDTTDAISLRLCIRMKYIG